ncbi:ABC transporter permease [Pararobbsia silviterrae]|uniref:ABC transporter permease n=1 Tax=Pararobbsia silviterrae TaxID=1792498 RepID=A0A494Y9I3_9BURK|nr:ABC transporter permease [Pararobbsia silviterrae]RKP56560.1 ABC transporter permease [Pararobbsia silviterrae]
MNTAVNPIRKSPNRAGGLRAVSFDASGLLPVVVVLALIAFFSVATSSFWTLRNLTALSGQTGTLLIVCLGSTFVVLMGSIDLSIGAIVLLVGAATVQLLNATPLGFAVVPAAALAGALLGVLNGAIYAYGRVPSFVVTLGSLSVFSGAGLLLLGGRAIQFNFDGFDAIAIGQWVPRLPNIALFGLIAWALTVVVSARTRFGRYMFLIGGGENIARTAGVPVRPYKIAAFGVSGLLAGLGAAFAVARLGAAGPSLGQDLLLNSLAAIVVGGTSLAGGVGGPQRTLLGVLIISILDDGLNLMGVSEYTQMIVKGLVVIAAVLVSRRGNTRALIIK